MQTLSRDYIVGALDQGARIYLNADKPRYTRVQMTVRDPELAEGLRAKYGGTFNGALWTLSGGRTVEAFLRSWGANTRREDVAPALAAMTAPAADAERASVAEFILSFASQPLTFAQLRALVPDVGEWRLRRLLDDLVAEGRLVRLPSEVRANGRGTTGYRYQAPALV